MNAANRLTLFMAMLVIGTCGAACREPGESENLPPSGSEGVVDESRPLTPGKERAPDKAAYDVARDPLVNPPRLLEPVPQDESLIARDEALQMCLKANPNTLNPILMSSAPEDRVRELVYDSLFKFDAKLQWYVNDAMVKSYEMSEDHLSAILKLKKGLVWHDGHSYTAADVVFSWEQIVDQRVPCPAARSGTDQIARCVAIDRLTVKFVFGAALPTNKWNVMFGVIPKHIYEKGKQDDPTLTRSDYYNRANRDPIGNGPYRFIKWTTDDKIVLQRWEGFHGRKPYFKRVTLRIVPNPNTRLLMFEKRQINEFELTPQQFVKETNSQSFRKVGVKGHAPQWKYTYLGWNQDGSNPFFVDRGVRRAMCHAINYDLILRQVYHGVYRRSYGIHHPSAPMFNPEIELFDFDLERASRLLDEAGWVRDAKDGWRYKNVNVNGKSVRTKFSFALNIPRESATVPRIAVILQNDLERIGVAMKIRTIEWATFLEMSRKHEFQAQISAWITGKDPDDEWNLWRTESYGDGRNYGGYSNPRVDELYELARGCFDEARRMRYYAEISKMIYEDAPYSFLVNAPVLWAFDKRLRGVQFSPRGPCNFEPGVRDWWVHKNDALRDTAPR